jgi:PAS domain S-box-containing protein
MNTPPAPAHRLTGRALTTLVAGLAAIVGAIVGAILFVTMFVYPVGPGSDRGLSVASISTASLVFVMGLATLRTGWRDAGMRWLISPWRTAGTVGIAGGLAILLVIAMFAQRSSRNLANAAAREKHAYQVIAGIRELRSHIDESRDALLGYVITGQEKFLTISNKGDSKWAETIRELREMTSGHARRQAQLGELDARIAVEIGAMRRMADTRRDAGFEAAALLMSAEGAAKSEEIRKGLDAMAVEEQQELAVGEVKRGALGGHAFAILPAGVLVSVLLLSSSLLRLNREMATRLRGTRMLAWEKGGLELISSPATLHEVLDGLLLGVEKHLQGARCVARLLEGGQLKSAAAPSLPESFNLAFDGLTPGPAASCGPAAHFDRQVIVPDILTDPLWAEYRELAAEHGLRAAWSTPIHDHGGELLGIFCIYHRQPGRPAPAELDLIARAVDVTRIAIERKRAEEKIRNLTAGLEQRVAERTAELQAANATLGDFKAALDQHAIVAITDARGAITYANDKFSTISKYSCEELLGQDHRIINSGHHPKAFIRDLWQTIGSGQVWKGEMKNRAKDGSIYWVDSTIVPFLGPDGKPAQFITIRSDITERKRAEEALRETEERVRLATEAASIGVWERDPKSNLLRWDARMFAIYGMPATPEALVSYRDWQARVLPTDLPEQEERLQRTIAACGQDQREFHIVRASDHAVRVIQAAERVIPGANGEAARIVGVNLDITERKQSEKKIQELNANLQRQAAELLESNRELEAFSYSVSHDLRAPLRAVDGFSRMVLADYAPKLDPEGCRMLGVIRGEAQRMGQLIDDLLAFSRLSRQPIEAAGIEMEELARSVFDELTAREPNDRLRLDLCPLPPARGSEAMIRQVWVNLIGNAIKFTKEREVAEIEIGAWDGGNSGRIYYVKDNGIGFDMCYVDKLFGVFQRLHSQEEFPGTGVGLALVQRIVRRHGGRVWAEGQVGQGATFYFTLPS